jgi:hypothetical protein
MTMLKVILHTALKSRLERKVLLPNTSFTGELKDLPKCIADAVEAKENYITVTELHPQDAPEVVADEVPEVVVTVKDTPDAIPTPKIARSRANKKKKGTTTPKSKPPVTSKPKKQKLVPKE